VIETTFEEVQMVGLAEKDAKAAIINIFRGLKETIFEEIRKGMMTMFIKCKDQERNKNDKRERNGNS
jgi:hypothetical protein